MLGWMNRAAFNETVESGKAVYFSRSRNSLWRKGETSGHVQEVEQILVDCDADAILLRVHQTGAACHAGFTSCFYRELNRTDNSWQEFEPRQFDPADVYGKSTPPSPPNPNE
jgi:phosphoribosyl-AMP cyclohydrolase